MKDPVSPRDQKAQDFTERIMRRIHAVLDSSPVEASVDSTEDRFWARCDAPGFELRVHKRPVGHLTFEFAVGLDHRGEHLKVQHSKFLIYSEVSRTPLVRLDFRGDASTEPLSHWQVHAQSGPVASWLTRARPESVQPRRDYGLDRLWLPTGGERFRPCLEDVLELLVVVLGADAKAGWREAITEGRLEWRGMQFAATVRDDPERAAGVLEGLGYSVTRPDAPPPARINGWRTW
jgi:hypothetical protein